MWIRSCRYRALKCAMSPFSKIHIVKAHLTLRTPFLKSNIVIKVKAHFHRIFRRFVGAVCTVETTY
jgi:hypothetical protein